MGVAVMSKGFLEDLREFKDAIAGFGKGFAGSVSGGCWGMEMPSDELSQLKRAKGFIKTESAEKRQ